MGAPRRPELSEPLKAAIYRRAQKGMSFTTTTLADELGLRKDPDRAYVARSLANWLREGCVQQLPKLGKGNLYQVKDGKLERFKPAPAPPPPAPTPVAAPRLQGAPSPQPATLDALMHTWLDGQLRPYGTMLKAVVDEVNRVRKDLDSVMDLLSKPEGSRPAMPEPLPRPVTVPPIIIEPRKTPVEDSALAVIVSRLGIEWHVEPSACDTFDELDGHSQTRVVRILSSAAQMNGAWPKLGKPLVTVPRSHAAPGTFWNFRAGKQHRVIIRRNGETKVLVAIVKRNDQRWYGTAREGAR